MDWYFGSNMDEFVVPRDQEVSESWLNWGSNEPESFTFPYKGFVCDANSTHKKFNVDGEILSNEVEVESCSCNRDRSSSSIDGGSSESSLHHSDPSCHQLDYQLNGLAGFEHADDLFLSSFIEDFPGSENFHESFSFEPELQNDMVRGDSTSTNMIFDDESVSVNAHSMGSSKYLKTHAFSPSSDQEKGRVSAPQLSSYDTEQKHCPSVEALPVNVLVPSEHNSTNEQVDEEASLEGSVLQELEMVMAQMNDKTRLCFRDALYRLAKNSKQNGATKNQSGDILMETPTQTDKENKIRVEGKKTKELETNTIDRAIANLMFNKMDMNLNEFPMATSINSNDECLKATREPNYRPNQPKSCSLSHYPIFSGDNEVPFLCQGYPE